MLKKMKKHLFDTHIILNLNFMEELFEERGKSFLVNPFLSGRRFGEALTGANVLTANFC
jgi:hypothetical protein